MRGRGDGDATGPTDDASARRGAESRGCESPGSTGTTRLHSAYHSPFDDGESDADAAAIFRELQADHGPVPRDELVSVLLAELGDHREETVSFREVLGVEGVDQVNDRLERVRDQLTTLEEHVASLDDHAPDHDVVTPLLESVQHSVDALGGEQSIVEEAVSELGRDRDDLEARVAVLEAGDATVRFDHDPVADGLATLAAQFDEAVAGLVSEQSRLHRRVDEFDERFGRLTAAIGETSGAESAPR